jgi:hypothetical protein
MALSGLHIVCGYPGAHGWHNFAVPLLATPQWSETLAAPGTTTHVAPVIDAVLGQPDLAVDYGYKLAWILA